MIDFACGTGGFITSWLGQLSKQVTDTSAQKLLDDSIYGIEKKPFPYLLCVTNMLLHDIEVPNIYHMNSLKHNLLDYTDDDKFDVILMNPPYGGHEDKSIQGFFPDDLASSETADLFMSVIMYRLKKNGRAAVVVPDGFLFGMDNAKVNIKKKLIGELNLHTVIRLPSSVFSPYTSITTNLLFFDNTKPTKETWFYRVDIPSDRKHFSKTKPMELKHFDDCIAWWNDRAVIPDGDYFKAQKYTADYLLNEQGCNIDLCGYPYEEEEVLAPADLISNLKELSDMANYLKTNEIYTIEDLESRVSTLKDTVDKLKITMDTETARMKEMRKMPEYVSTLQELKPIVDGLQKIKFDKARAKYKAEHEKELKRYYAARRKVLEMFPDGKYDGRILNKQYAELEQVHKETYAKFIAIREEYQCIWYIQSCVERGLGNTEQTQQKKDNREQEGR